MSEEALWYVYAVFSIASLGCAVPADLLKAFRSYAGKMSR